MNGANENGRRRRAALEKKRVEALSKNLARWQERRQILDYVAVVEQRLAGGEVEDPAAVRDWIAWARAYAARIDPLSGSLSRLLRFEDFHSWDLWR